DEAFNSRAFLAASVAPFSSPWRNRERPRSTCRCAKSCWRGDVARQIVMEKNARRGTDTSRTTYLPDRRIVDPFMHTLTVGTASRTVNGWRPRNQSMSVSCIESLIRLDSSQFTHPRVSCDGLRSSIVRSIKEESAREDRLKSEALEGPSPQRGDEARSQRRQYWNASREQTGLCPTSDRLWTAKNRVPPDGSRHCGAHDGWRGRSALNGQGS